MLMLMQQHGNKDVLLSVKYQSKVLMDNLRDIKSYKKAHLQIISNNAMRWIYIYDIYIFLRILLMLWFSVI